MANQIMVYGVAAEFDSSGLWTSLDADLAADLNFRCSTADVDGATPDPAAALLACAVEKFKAVVIDRDPAPEGVRGRVY